MSDPTHELGESPEPERDGRKRRRQQSREAILRALAEAIVEPDFQPSPEWLAARSGYSISTIFRHFGGRDGLAAAVQDLVRQRVDEHLSGGPPEGDVRTRVAELVRRVSAVFETASPFLRAVEPDRQRMIGDRARHILDLRVRCQIDDALAQELSAQPADTTDLLATVLSVGAWGHMRAAQGHSTERAAELMEAAVLRLLGVPVETPRA
ncbi:MAG: hypothetical protein AAF430_24820 [Myxococcota bacterium]